MKKIVLFSLLPLLLTSCWKTQYTTITDVPSKYLGNVYAKLKGNNENQILQIMSVAPDRTMSDGANGRILIYEDQEVITRSYSSMAGYSTTGSAAIGGYTRYGNPAVVGGSSTVSNSNYSNTTSTGVNKKYVNFFINSDGQCYNVKTNIGDQYSKAITHTERYKVANSNLLYGLIPPMIFYGIPGAIWYAINKNKIKVYNRATGKWEKRKRY